MLAGSVEAALFDAVYGAIPVGLAYFSPDGRFERVNPALATINGWPAEQHLGRTIEEVLGPEDGARIAGFVREVMVSGRAVVDQEITLADPGAGPEGVRYFEASYFPVLVEGEGEPAGVGAVVREVTERHRAESERRRLLKEAVTARAHAEAALLRAESAQHAAEEARAMAERERARLEFLAEAGRRMAASMDYETTLQGVAESVVPMLADWCVISVADPGGGVRTLAAAHSDPAKLALLWELTERYPRRTDEPSMVTKVIVTGEMDLIREIPEELLLHELIGSLSRAAPCEA